MVFMAGCGSSDGGGAASGKSAEVAIAKLGLKVTAPEGTKVSDMMGDQMLQGPGLVATVAEAKGDYAKDSAAAVKAMKDTYDGLKNVKEEKLSDGYIVTAENKGGMGTNYWVKSVRTIGGKAYKCETTAPKADIQAAAVKACKSLKK
jgi:hypothetical protein